MKTLLPHASFVDVPMQSITKSFLPIFTSPQGEIETLRVYQTVLNQWRVPFIEFDVSTSFGETHIIASGPEGAPPVVLLHALFATATSWYRNVDSLSQHYRTYAVDILGEANKSCPIRPITSLDDFFHWFTEVIDQLGIAQLYLVGNSFGGFMSAYFAMHMRDRMRKLVLIAPVATFHSMRAFYVNMFIHKAFYLYLPWLSGRQRVMRRSVDWMFAGLPSDGVWKDLFTLVLLYGSMTNQVLPRVYTRQEFAQITAPTLLVLGEQEKIYPICEVREAARRLMPTIEVQIIPNAHHITALAQPELVNATLLRFFQEGESH